jgi:hypothetical protein
LRITPRIISRAIRADARRPFPNNRQQRWLVGRQHVVVVGAIGVGSETWNFTPSGMTPSFPKRSNRLQDASAISA